MIDEGLVLSLDEGNAVSKKSTENAAAAPEATKPTPGSMGGAQGAH